MGRVGNVHSIRGRGGTVLGVRGKTGYFYRYKKKEKGVEMDKGIFLHQEL